MPAISLIHILAVLALFKLVLSVTFLSDDQMNHYLENDEAGLAQLNAPYVPIQRLQRPSILPFTRKQGIFLWPVKE